MRLLAIFVAVATAALGCSRTGSFAQPATAIPQPITFGTGTACQPKIVLFFYNNLTTDGGGANGIFGFGAGASSSARFASFAFTQDALNTSDANKTVSQALAILITTVSGTTVASADMTSLDSDGFTITWAAADATARIINYIAWGGADVTNVEIGSFNTAASTEINTTGAWQPDLVILHFGGTAGSTTASIRPVIGMVTASDSWSITAGVNDNAGTSNTQRLQRTTQSFASANTGTDAIDNLCTTAIDSDGFTQTCPTINAIQTQYIAIKGGSYKLGAFNQVTSSGSQDVTTIGFTPKALLLASYGTTSQTAVQTTASMAIGAGTSSSSRWSVWWGDLDAQAGTEVASSYLDRAAIFQARTSAGATPTALSSADLTSFSAATSGTFTINVTTADAVARQLLYLAISTSEAAPSTSNIPRRMIKW